MGRPAHLGVMPGRLECALCTMRSFSAVSGLSPPSPATTGTVQSGPTARGPHAGRGAACSPYNAVLQYRFRFLPAQSSTRSPGPTARGSRARRGAARPPVPRLPAGPRRADPGVRRPPVLCEGRWTRPWGRFRPQLQGEARSWEGK
jgi:hypothetical protein